MAKRGAASELNDRNWDDEEEPEEAGTFIQASSDVMQARVIKKAKRRTANEEGEGNKPVFGGFGGLAATSTLSKSATTGSGVSFGLGGMSSFKASSFGGASSVNGAKEKKIQSNRDSKDSSSYLHSLKSLNESVLAWIKQHVEENPYIFLTPIFKDYQNHLEVIEAKRLTGSPAGGSGDSKTEPAKHTESNATTAKPTFAASFAASKSESESGGGTTEDSKNSVKPFTFGLATSQSEAKPAPFGGLSSSNGGFKFSSSGSSTSGFTFGAATKTDSVAVPPPSLGKTSGFSFGSSVGSTSSLFSGAATSTTSAGNSSQSAGSKDDEEYVPPKPEVREIKEDDALYSKRCKLYFQRDGQWVDRGVGNLHLKPISEDKTQLLIRADTNLGNILLNIMLSASMPIMRQGKNNVSLSCVPNPPLTSKPDEKPSDIPVPMLIRVKTAEDADELFGKIDERRKLQS